MADSFPVGTTDPAPMFTRVGVDPADWLPSEAAEKVILLRQHAHDLQTAIPRFEDRLEAAGQRN
jgi:hypothetical protein